MESKQKLDVFQSFMTQVDHLYDHPERLSDQEKKVLFNIEEFLSRIMIQDYLKGEAIPQTRHEYVAIAVDDFLDGRYEKLNSLSACELQVAISLIQASKKMSDESVPNKALPDALKNIIKKSIEVQEKVPALLIRIVEEGIDLVTTTFKDMYQVEILAPVVRKASSPSKASTPLALKQTIDMQGNAGVEYQIIKESDHELMLNMTFHNVYGINKVLLKQDGKIISSHNLEKDKNSVTLNRLTPGIYEFEVKGVTTNYFLVEIQKGF